MAFKSKKRKAGKGAAPAPRIAKKKAPKAPKPPKPPKPKKAPKPKKVKAPKPAKAPKPPKKSKTRAKIERKLESKAESLVLGKLKKYGGKAGGVGLGALALPAKAGVAALGAAGTVVAVGAAFAVGYGIGKGLIALWDYFSAEERNFRKAKAFREARIAFELKYDRKPDAAEVKEIQKGVGFGVENKPPPKNFAGIRPAL